MSLLLLAFAWVSAWAQTSNQLTPQDYQGLSERFVTTIKETQVDEQLLTVAPIQQCLEQNKISEQDIKDNKSKEKRAAAKKCLEDKFQNVSESDLKKLEEQLQLEQFGLVKGKSAQALTKFFTERLQNALYGTGAAGEANRSKDRTVVDHAVFTDIYESRVSKNFLLDVSRFCYEDLYPTNTSTLRPRPGSTEFFQAWTKLTQRNGNDPASCDKTQPKDKLVRNCFSSISDESSASGTVSDKTDIYKQLSEAVKDGTAGTQANEVLRNLLDTCMGVIAPMCEVQVYCAELSKAGGDAALKAKVNGQYPDYSSVTCRKDFGKKACEMQNKIRSYRLNLAALKVTKEQLDQLQDVDDKGNFKLDSDIGTYNAGNVSEDRSIESITTVTSSEISGALKKSSEEYSEEFTKEGCDQNPEDKRCEKFFYSNEEAVKFANQGMLYDAATEREKAKIQQLKDSRPDLEKYLTEKGYADLLESLKGGGSSEEVVALAKARFEAERNSAYDSMDQAFTNKQTLAKSPAQLENLKKQNEKQAGDATAFNQLLLFNNVVTSFLETTDEKGEAKSNSGVLERELKGKGIDGEAMQFFSNLSSSSGSSTTTSPKKGGNETISVDLQLVDTILSGKQPKKADKLK